MTEIGVALRVLNLGLGVLNLRLLTSLAMLLTAGLFAWVMWEPDYIRLAAAIAFGLIVFLPARSLERSPEPPKED